MECDICGHHASQRNPRPFHCASCARAAVYPLRIEQLQILLRKEELGKKVEQVITGNVDTAHQSISLSNTLVDTYECAKRVDLDRILSETAEATERVELISEQADRLRKEMETYKAEIAARKASMAQRKSDTESATHGLEGRRDREIQTAQQTISRTKYRWGRLHNETMQARHFLCREAAKLAGLNMKRKKGRDGKVRDEFTIGGVKIFNLKDMNGMASSRRHTLVSTNGWSRRGTCTVDSFINPCCQLVGALLALPRAPVAS